MVHLTPATLAECLLTLRGPQIVIVAACYGGLFLPLDHAWPAFLDELSGARCGVAFSALVPKGTTMPLADAFARAAQRLNDAKAKNLPLCSGAVSWPDK